MTSKSLWGLLALAGGLGAALFVLPQVLGKQRTVEAIPSAGRPGDSFILYITGFNPPQITMVVEGYLTNPDQTYIRNIRPDGSAEYNFTVELDRPAGDYFITVYDDQASVTEIFTVLP